MPRPGPTGGTIALQWTAPGNDGGSGTIINGTYKIQYATFTSVTFSTASAQVSFSTSNVNPGDTQYYTLAGLTGNVTYYIRLWTADQNGNWSGLSNGATSWALVYPPTMLLPASSAWINTSSPTFAWSVSNNTSTQNIFDLGTSALFSSILQSNTTTALVFQSTVALANNTTYDWRMRAIDNSGLFSPLWSTFTFTTDLTSPSASGFQSYNTLGSTITETQSNNLLSGVTAQITIQDTLSGLTTSPFELVVTNNTQALWHFDENVGSIALENSGRNFTVTFVNNTGMDERKDR